ncbi:MAG TPA: hypothetical protein VFF06_16420 [Polyangia bacterium]|nr:hypothetical protein [Polyangia bacterium]
MSFGRWEPLDDAEAPAGPGVLQARRAEGLIDYPTGKSAMIHYGADDVALSAALERLRAALSPADRAATLVRFAPADGREAPSETLERLLRQFAARFGAPPHRDR